MQYRNLGRWGVKVSAVGLGSWLTYGGTVEADTARACIHRALDHGITFFDTANAYVRGASEEVVGAALAGVRRDDYVLATKVFFPMGDGPNDRGLSRKHVWEQCTASLRRLGVDHIDLYQCHRYDESTPLEETCRVMDDLVRAGKVLYWGTSEWTADQIAHALSVCRDLGVGNVVWSPLAMGVLTGKYTSTSDLPEDSRAASEGRGFMEAYLRQETLDAVASLRPVAEEAGCSLSQLALAWLLRQDTVSSVIVGATKVEHVDDNAAAGDLRVPDDVLDRVGEVLAPV